jgi:hypothetical protein
LNRSARGQAEDSRKAMVDKVDSMKNYLNRRAGCLYGQTVGSWNILDTLVYVIMSDNMMIMVMQLDD